MDLIQCKSALNPDIIKGASFRATLATDTPLPHLVGQVQLSHEPGATTIPQSLPLQIGHDLTSLPVGRITDIRQSHGQTTGTVTLAQSVRETIGRDILDGMITDLSIGASVDDHTQSDDGTIVATHWTPVEASLVAVGKDPGAKIHRALTMTTPNETTAHATRVQEIKALFVGLDSPDWLKVENSALSGTDPIDVIRNTVMDKLKANASKPVDVSPVADVQAGEDAFDKFATGFSEALEIRSGLVPSDKRKDAERAYAGSPFRGLSLMDGAREFLRSVNVDTTGLDRMSVASKALYVSRAGVIGHAAGDFTQLLAANVNKSLSKGYDEAEETWQAWTGRDEAPDFKQSHRPVLSAFSDLDEVISDGEYKYGTFSDKEEVFTMQRWGKLFSIGRTAIVNDDLAAFSRIPRAMGRAAARKVGDEAYSFLSGGIATKTMNEDAQYLFHADHSNYVASGAGAAISVATLNTARAAMSTQTEQGGHTIKISPRHLLCSEASLGTAETIVAAAFNPATASGVDPMPGYIGRLQVTSDPRIDGDVATKWYLAADPMMHDTILVAFLDGISEPMLEEHDGGPSRDSVIFKVRHEFTVYAGDYRGLYLNYGA